MMKKLLHKQLKIKLKYKRKRNNLCLKVKMKIKLFKKITKQFLIKKKTLFKKKIKVSL